MPWYNRPGIRLKRKGVSALSDAELLAIVLGRGNKKENAIDCANRLLYKYNFDKLSDISFDELKKESWHTLNGVYCYFPEFPHGDNNQIYAAFFDETKKSPTMPSFLIESKYEGGDKPAQYMRRQAYWALLSGAAGHLYGHEKVCVQKSDNVWKKELNDPGANV